MAHNIEGFKEHYEIIETKRFYKKYSGTISIKNKVKVIAETEKAILIREGIQFGKEAYSINPMWIAKSLIISRKDYKPDSFSEYQREQAMSMCQGIWTIDDEKNYY